MNRYSLIATVILLLISSCKFDSPANEAARKPDTGLHAVEEAVSAQKDTTVMESAGSISTKVRIPSNNPILDFVAGYLQDSSNRKPRSWSPVKECMEDAEYRDVYHTYHFGVGFIRRAAWLDQAPNASTTTIAQRRLLRSRDTVEVASLLIAGAPALEKSNFAEQNGFLRLKTFLRFLAFYRDKITEASNWQGKFDTIQNDTRRYRLVQAETYHRNGFYKHPNQCYQMVFGWVSLEGWVYSFWLRRYMEGSFSLISSAIDYFMVYANGGSPDTVAFTSELKPFVQLSEPTEALIAARLSLAEGGEDESTQPTVSDWFRDGAPMPNRKSITGELSYWVNGRYRETDIIGNIYGIDRKGAPHKFSLSSVTEAVLDSYSSKVCSYTGTEIKFAPVASEDIPVLSPETLVFVRRKAPKSTIATSSRPKMIPANKGTALLRSFGLEITPSENRYSRMEHQCPKYQGWESKIGQINIKMLGQSCIGWGGDGYSGESTILIVRENENGKTTFAGATQDEIGLMTFNRNTIWDVDGDLKPEFHISLYGGLNRQDHILELDGNKLVKTVIRGGAYDGDMCDHSPLVSVGGLKK